MTRLAGWNPSICGQSDMIRSCGNGEEREEDEEKCDSSAREKKRFFTINSRAKTIVGTERRVIVCFSNLYHYPRDQADGWFSAVGGHG